jgi:DNA-binding NtrC family response regulator
VYLVGAKVGFGREVEGFTKEGLEYWLEYGWPGKVRELKNMVEAIFVNLPVRHLSWRSTLTSNAPCRVQHTVPGVRVGCFPDLDAALSANRPDQLITC